MGESLATVRDPRGSDALSPAVAPGGYPLVGPHAAPLYATGAPGVLTDGREEYPVVAGIPYLIAGSTRPGLEGLRQRACAALRDGDERAALRLLLRDQDRFSPTPPPSEAAVDQLIERRDDPALTLRGAMRLLDYGPVADYFAHRWSSPTFLSGLALLGRTASTTRPVIEVACGLGHFLRALEGRGCAAVGIDIVFSKLWLARHFVGVRGLLVCGDIERSPVLAPGPPDADADRSHTVFCHDAFYFFEHKRAALTSLRSLARHGAVALGHVHTRTDAHEAGFAARLTDYRAILPPGAPLLDDLALARAYVADEATYPEATRRSAALATLTGKLPERLLTFAPPRRSLRVNPLLTPAGDLAYPSAGWRAEFEADSAPLGEYGLAASAKTPRVRALLRGEVGIDDLSDAEVAALYRRRVLLDLPARW